jgi:hypothetical protein
MPPLDTARSSVEEGMLEFVIKPNSWMLVSIFLVSIDGSTENLSSQLRGFSMRGLIPTSLDKIKYNILGT